MTLILLARHGATFNPGETAYFVGARQDLPLTETGEAQARAIGQALGTAGLKPARIICGPLIRTRRTAQIAGEEARFSGAAEIDARLREIDFGAWGGKTDAQVIEEYGEDALRAWREQGRRPAGAGWSPDEDTLKDNARAVLADAAAGPGPVLLVTSNGVLRYVHQTLGLDGDHKVGVGRVCAAIGGEGGISPAYWNRDPADGLSV